MVEEFLGEARPDFWVSDRYGAQLGWAKTDNELCLAHLIRDAQYAIEAGDAAFAPGLKHLKFSRRHVRAGLISRANFHVCSE